MSSGREESRSVILAAVRTLKGDVAAVQSYIDEAARIDGRARLSEALARVNAGLDAVLREGRDDA